MATRLIIRAVQTSAKYPEDFGNRGCEPINIPGCIVDGKRRTRSINGWATLEKTL
jgi:hypothetical protein